jgi:hypothetical protein
LTFKTLGWRATNSAMPPPLNLKYIHMAIPLHISTFYEQGNIQEIYLKNLANTTTSEICHIPFTKAAWDTGVWGLRKLSKIMNQVVNLGQI